MSINTISAECPCSLAYVIPHAGAIPLLCSPDIPAMDDLCDICGYDITDEMSAHAECEAEFARRVKEKMCVKCGQEVEEKTTTHQECLGLPYIGYCQDYA